MTGANVYVDGGFNGGMMTGTIDLSSCSAERPTGREITRQAEVVASSEPI